MSFLPNQAEAAVVLREAILACYRSGQMSAAQWERHCEDDPELRTMVEAPKVGQPICTPVGWKPASSMPIGRYLPSWREGESDWGFSMRIEPDEWVLPDGRTTVTHHTVLPPTHWFDVPHPKDASPGVKTGATDPIAAMREALGVLCDEIEATEEHGAAAFENFCPVCKAIEGARAALASYDAAAASSDLESAILRAERDDAREKLGECHAGYETLRKELAAAQAERDEAREALEYAEGFFKSIRAIGQIWFDRSAYMTKIAKTGEERMRAALGKRGEG